jgi:uncharacterized membrane protein YidH (DUF202 family)
MGYNIVIQMRTKINNGEAIAPPRQNLEQEKAMIAWMRANLPLTLRSFGQELMIADVAIITTTVGS